MGTAGCHRPLSETQTGRPGAVPTSGLGTRRPELPASLRGRLPSSASRWLRRAPPSRWSWDGKGQRRPGRARGHPGGLRGGWLPAAGASGAPSPTGGPRPPESRALPAGAPLGSPRPGLPSALSGQRTRTAPRPWVSRPSLPGLGGAAVPSETPSPRAPVSAPAPGRAAPAAGPWHGCPSAGPWHGCPSAGPWHGPRGLLALPPGTGGRCRGSAGRAGGPPAPVLPEPPGPREGARAGKFEGGRGRGAKKQSGAGRTQFAINGGP